MAKSPCFLKITNEDVYKKLCEIETKVDKHYLENIEGHNNIVKRLDYTNGKVKRGMWIASTALSLSLLVLGFLFQHISN